MHSHEYDLKSRARITELPIFNNQKALGDHFHQSFKSFRDNCKTCLLLSVFIVPVAKNQTSQTRKREFRKTRQKKISLTFNQGKNMITKQLQSFLLNLAEIFSFV